ncbi:hypothetical protein MUP32_01050 [Candidatus Microgenomates bacterium]|nr:hypothetical protein [Candidatus Microgenomates bacterium]
MLIANLSKTQLNRLSEILGNMSLVFLAAMVVPALSVDIQVKLPVIMSGIFLTLACIYTSLILLKGGG